MRICLCVGEQACLRSPDCSVDARKDIIICILITQAHQPVSFANLWDVASTGQYRS
jgi:hypothetical protein